MANNTIGLEKLIKKAGTSSTEILSALIDSVKQGWQGVQYAGQAFAEGVKEGQPQQSQQTQLKGDIGSVKSPFTPQLPQQQIDEKSLDPLQQNVLKTVKKVQSQQVEEAMQQGVPAEHIMQQVGVPIGQDQTKSGLTQQPQQHQILQPTSPFTRQQLTPEGDLQLGGFFDFGGQTLSQIIKAQQITGQQLLQKGEREKISIELDKELKKIASTPVDALNVEQSSKFGLMLNGQKSLGIAAEMIANNPNVISGSKMPGFLKTQEGRQLITHMETAYEGQLRATSGATLGEKEIQRKVKQYGQSLTDNPKTLNTKLKSLNNWYNYSINTADPSGTHRQRALGQQNNPGVLDAIRAEKQRRGLK